MIDLHAHLLPHMDDGAQDLPAALAMAGKAWEDGTTVMVATPHMHNGLYENDRQKILEATERLRRELSRAAIPLTLLPGADVAMTPSLLPELDAGRVMTMNDAGRYLLVELPPVYNPARIEEIIFGLRTRGITPILTHPERDAAIARSLPLLERFIEMGCLAQLTAMSLTGGFGGRIRSLSLELLRRGMIHVIASDCHSPERRGPSLKEAAAAAGGILGAEGAFTLVEETPRAVIEGRPVAIPPVRRRERRVRGPFWRRLLGG